jgi:hypothetical protein
MARSKPRTEADLGAGSLVYTVLWSRIFRIVVHEGSGLD